MLTESKKAFIEFMMSADVQMCIRDSRMGVQGVAYATILAQGVSAVLVVLSCV